MANPFWSSALMIPDEIGSDKKCYALVAGIGAMPMFEWDLADVAEGVYVVIGIHQHDM